MIVDETLVYGYEPFGTRTGVAHMSPLLAGWLGFQTLRAHVLCRNQAGETKMENALGDPIAYAMSYCLVPLAGLGFRVPACLEKQMFVRG